MIKMVAATIGGLGVFLATSGEHEPMPLIWALLATGGLIVLFFAPMGKRDEDDQNSPG